MEKKLNPRWLYAAFVYDEEGKRIGTVRTILCDGDTIAVGITGDITNKSQFFSASSLDKKGLINKPNAVDKKYVEVQ